MTNDQITRLFAGLMGKCLHVCVLIVTALVASSSRNGQRWQEL